jgi:hypothetical protein
MKLLSVKNGFGLSLLLLMPGALKAMDATQSAKWSTWTRFYLERKHTSDLSSSFFEADNHCAIDEIGNVTLVNPKSAEYEVVEKNSASTNQERQEAIRYGAKVTVLKASLNGNRYSDKLNIEYSIFKTCVGSEPKTLVPPTALTIGCNHVENITVENMEPFDLYITTNVYEAEKNRH